MHVLSDCYKHCQLRMHIILFKTTYATTQPNKQKTKTNGGDLCSLSCTWLLLVSFVDETHCACLYRTRGAANKAEHQVYHLCFTYHLNMLSHYRVNQMAVGHAISQRTLYTTTTTQDKKNKKDRLAPH